MTSNPAGSDHPRSRGEYTEVLRGPPRPPGSSPLSRGILRGGTPRSHSPGIIPALAGNTPRAPQPATRRGDHPRSRGEYRGGEPGRLHQNGSSPLSRGIQDGAVSWGHGSGIIPALAGNTYSMVPNGTNPRDHPRSRGEYAELVGEPEIIPGSSPLSRGIPRVILAIVCSFGIIPALAGNTRPGAWLGPLGRDHPRSRGEYGIKDVWVV